MYIGVEIGGTKLQTATGLGDGLIVHRFRAEADATCGGESIRQQVLQLIADARAELPANSVRGIGIGFGGPVNVQTGRIARSHQVDGWEDFPIVKWLCEKTGIPVVLQNDADTAGLGEALHGAGQGDPQVFYMTVGSGIGGGLILNGEIFRGNGSGAGEVGHMRIPHDLLGDGEPGPTVESLASGWAIAARARDAIESQPESPEAADLLQRAGGDTQAVTTKLLGESALAGNRLAIEQLRIASRVLGWTLAQVIALFCPEVLIVGGGVSLVPEQLLMEPLRDEVDRQVFGPFRGKYRIATSQLGEDVVLHGALALARANDPH